MSDSSWPHGLQPTKLLRPWDFPGKSTGVGCHCLLQIILLWTYKCVSVWTCFIFLRYLEVKLLGHIITPCLTYFFGHAMEYVGSWFPDQGSNTKLMHWKHGVLTTGLPGKSPLCLTFWGIIRLFPKKLLHFTFLPELCEGSDTPLPWQHLLLSIFLIITTLPVESGISLWFWLSVCLQCGRPGFDPWVGKFPGERNGNPLQYYCLENPMDRGAWLATVHGVAKSRTWQSNLHDHDHDHERE